jgi:protein-L-isoaspartate(D-aspartate) O-methyltransferase
MMTNRDLIRELRTHGVLDNPAVAVAFEAVARADFVLPKYREQAYGNHPLPIGLGQTISQPYTVAFMLDLLDVKKGERILEIGAGSGWQTALLCCLAGPDGRVVSIERIPELRRQAESNLAKYPRYQRTSTLVQGDGSRGFSAAAPFDKIIAAAAGQAIPKAWKEQLKVSGRIVAPVLDSVLAVEKISEDEYQVTEYPGFAFVPLVEG